MRFFGPWPLFTASMISFANGRTAFIACD